MRLRSNLSGIHSTCRSEHRSERAQERVKLQTSRALGYKLAFLLYCALRHSNLQASSSHRPIARDRRGSLLGHSSVNNAG